MTAHSTRDRLLQAATRLLAQRGYRGLGVSELLREAGATAGSLYHYFPGGKEELAATAIREAGAAGRQVMLALAEQLDLAAAVRAFFDIAGRGVEDSQWQLGCPVGTPAADGVTASENVAGAIEESLTGWVTVLVEQLRTRGVSEDRATELAAWAVAAYEGALLVTRARQDAAVVRTSADQVVAEFERAIGAS